MLEVDLDELDLLIVENVGNPVCPANFNLGEHARVSLLSVVEGHDKPSKYGGLFKGAAAIVLTKYELAGAVGFDESIAVEDLRRVNSAAPLFRTDIRSGRGIDEVASWLRGFVRNN